MGIYIKGDKICKRCKKPMPINHKNYCSRECQKHDTINRNSKLCPICGKKFIYKGHGIKPKKYCSRECSYISMKGRKSVFKGKKHSDKSKRKQSEIKKGKKLSNSTKEKLRKSLKGRQFTKEHKEKIQKSLTGKKHTQDRKKNQRIAAIYRIQKHLEEGHQIIPSWNPKACDYFEEFDKDNNTKGQHARNGGEFNIKELGYWVDYINHDLKLIMEYDEKYHHRQKEKDMIRQQEIQELYPDYEFRRIKDEF